MNESLKRLELLIGNKIDAVKNKTVLVIGLGGVGGYAVEALVRLGIGHLILVDNDIIEMTNINRQLIATTKTVGKNKTEAWKERIKDINPNCKVTLINEFITSDNIDSLFNKNYDFLIDACDTILTKKEIIKRCVGSNIPFITCMGMGNKLDPTKIEIIDIRKTSYDPIAKIIRKMVKDEKINAKVMTVCSTEKPIKNNHGIISSNAIVPSVAGLYCANYIFSLILKEE